MEEFQMPSRHQESSPGLVEMDFSLVLFILPLFFSPLCFSFFLSSFSTIVSVFFVLFPLLFLFPLLPSVLITTSSPHYGIVTAPNKQTMRHGRRQEDSTGRRTCTPALLWAVISPGLAPVGCRVVHAACSLLVQHSHYTSHISISDPTIASTHLYSSSLLSIELCCWWPAGSRDVLEDISCLSRFCLSSRSRLSGRLLYLIMSACAQTRAFRTRSASGKL